ncbi:hypothetical protein Tco_1095780 [Tanacetum coccineum]
MGKDSDHPTDSTPIPIIDQPSSSSQPKKDKPSQKAQRQEAEVLDLQKAKDAQAKEIAALKKRIQRLERRKMSRPTGLKRLSKVGMSRRGELSKDQESLGVHEDASKQGRSIADINADVEVTLVNETQVRQNDDLIFNTGVLDDVEMPVEAKVDGKDEQSTKTDDSTAGEAVTTANDDNVVPTTNEEITLAQTLIQIKAAKPKVVTTTAATATTIRPKDKRVVRKDQIALDEQIARDIQAKLDAELLEEQKLSRKQEEEANITLIESWENTQAMMEADRLLAKRLQSKEREELTDEEKAKLFMELMEKEKKKHFACLEVQESNEKKKVRRFTEETAIVCMKEDAWEGKEQEIKLKKLLVIKKDEDIAIDAIPLATKLPDLIQEIRLEEDLEALWRIVKAKYGDTRPENEFERVLYGDLKVMFEPDIKSDVWRMLQGYRVTIWKLIDSSGVHFVKFDNLHIFMLVERRYPLTPITITNMLNKRLQTDHQNDMCYQLLKLIG